MMTATAADVGLEIHPYPGLRPFYQDETHVYFGREEHRGELLKRLTVTRFVAVIGTSGSGKSSLVRAGLLPDLLSGYLPSGGSDWVVVESKPGDDPFGRLAAAFVAAGWMTSEEELRTDSSHILDLANRHLAPGQHLLVLVDQFEELFRLKVSEDPAEDGDEKAAFVRLLLNAGGQRPDLAAQNPRVHMVMAMRSEFLGRASVYRGLPEAIDQGQYLIPRLTREQLRRAIESPARVAGGEVEDALVQRLLNELGDDQDQLPVLQHALMRCWNFRNADERIGLEAYEKSGQLTSALSIDANEALAETRTALGGRGERILMRVFQGLRETDVNGGQTRRPTTVHELCELAECTADELTTALAPFRGRSFVLPPPDSRLEDATLLDISHEALLRRWDTLGRWIDEDDQDRRRYLRLATRAAEEQGSARPQYLMPPQLDLLVKFWAERKPSRAWGLRHHKGYERAKAFLDESEQNRRVMEDEEANRRAEESRQKQELARAISKRRRMGWQAGGVVGVLVAVVVIVVLAWSNAIEQGRRLEALALAAKLPAIPEGQIETRLQLAAEVARRRQDSDSRSELLKTLFIAAMPKEWSLELAEDVEYVALSQRSRQLYAVAGDQLRVIELATGRQRSSLPLSEFKGNGNLWFLLASGEKLLMVWDESVSVVDGTTLTPLASLNFDAHAFTASSDGSRAAFLVSNSVILCDLVTNCESRRQYDLKGMSASDLELSADGKTLVIFSEGEASDPDQIALFDTVPWKLRKTRPIATSMKLGIGVDEDHVHFCTPDTLWQFDAYDDSLDERVVQRFTSAAEHCRFFGERTVSSHADGAIRVWDQAGALLSLASGAADAGEKLALEQGMLVAATASIMAWDITRYGRRENVAATPAGFAGNAHVYSEDGTLIALDSGTVAETRPLLFEYKRPLKISDSLRLALYRTQPSEFTLATLQPGKDPDRRGSWTHDSKSRFRFLQAAISPDDRYVAIGYSNRSGTETVSETVILDAADAKPVGEPLKGMGAAFSRDGHFLALAAPVESQGDRQPSLGSIIRLFEWPGRKAISGEDLRHSANVISLSFTPDGRALLTSTDEGTTHLWDVETRLEILRIPPPGRGNVTAVYTPSGHVAILQGDTLTVLPADPDDLLAEACRRISRNLTEQQWMNLVGADIRYRKTCPDRP